jgi:hypothetical protein
MTGLSVNVKNRPPAYRWGLNETEIGANNPHTTMSSLYLEPLQHAWRVIKGWWRPRNADVAMPPASG